MTRLLKAAAQTHYCGQSTVAYHIIVIKGKFYATTRGVIDGERRIAVWEEVSAQWRLAYEHPAVAQGVDREIDTWYRRYGFSRSVQRRLCGGRWSTFSGLRGVARATNVPTVAPPPAYASLPVAPQVLPPPGTEQPVEATTLPAAPSLPVAAAPAVAAPSLPVAAAPAPAAPSLPVAAAPASAAPSLPVVAAPAPTAPSLPVVAAPAPTAPSLPVAAAPATDYEWRPPATKSSWKRARQKRLASRPGAKRSSWKSARQKRLASRPGAKRKFRREAVASRPSARVYNTGDVEAMRRRYARSPASRPPWKKKPLAKKSRVAQRRAAWKRTGKAAGLASRKKDRSAAMSSVKRVSGKLRSRQSRVRRGAVPMASRKARPHLRKNASPSSRATRKYSRTRR